MLFFLPHQVKKLAKILEELGEVNILAIEELEKTEERCLYTTKQLEDLEEARDTLLATIDEINKVCEQKLKKTFQENFHL